jgi:hypothetical protein
VPDLQAELERRLAEAAAAGSGPGPHVELSDAEIRRLRSIGYVSDEGKAKD